jgi:hypothetical protein
MRSSNPHTAWCPLNIELVIGKNRNIQDNTEIQTKHAISRYTSLSQSYKHNIRVQTMNHYVVRITIQKQNSDISEK